jgi:hypothetical protein
MGTARPDPQETFLATPADRLALAEEDDVASQLRDEELKNAARQIRALGAAAHTRSAA